MPRFYSRTKTPRQFPSGASAAAAHELHSFGRMRFTSIIGALAVAITCGLTFLGGFGLGYDAGFDDKVTVTQPVGPVAGPVTPIADVPTTTLLAVDNSGSVTVDEKVWR